MRKPLQVVFAVGSMAGGGSERQVATILQQLDRKRISPTLYLLDRSGEFLQDVPADVPVISCGDTLQPSAFYVPGGAYRRQVRHLTQTLREGGFDLLYDRTILMACVAGPAARRAGARRVAAVVADPDRDTQAMFRRFGWLKRRILQAGYRDAARVIANSDGLRRAVAERFQLPEARTAVIPNGFDVSFIQQQATVDSHVSINPRQTHIAAMGRFQPQKGFPDLIRAVRHLIVDRQRSDLVLWLLGTGPEESLYRRLIAEEPSIADHVRLPGFLPNPFSFISRVRLFCLSSHYEGSPNALVEAMACGTPVIATNCPYGPREILEGGRLGELVSPGDWAALAEAIDRVITDEAMAHERAVLAVASVQERFDAKRSVRQLEDLFESLV
jgi:glycosyltransferase involved in cell wall biosynthesis